MRRAPELSVILISPASSESEPVCRLLHESRDTGLTLPGAILEAAFAAGDGWLVLLTHDVPYEEGLEICLVSAGFELLDRATLAHPYATAMLKNLEASPPARLRFDFLGERRWEVELLDGPSARVPFFSEPTGVLRPFGLTRRFRVGHV